MAETTLPKLLRSREEARQKIQTQIEKGQQLHDLPIDSDDKLDKVGMEANNWSKYNTYLLTVLFDTPVPGDEYTNFNYSRLTYDDADNIFIENPHVSDIHEYRMHEYQAAMEDSISSLKEIYERLELYYEPSETSQSTFVNERVSDVPQSTFGDKVFIVHGRDDGAKEAVARFVENLGIEATILHEQPSGGRTIIEQIERYSREACFAIVLITPDDVGALRDEADDERNPRARQNVVFELGYFIGKLGRERVCPLFKGEVESPSDIDGVVYVTMDNAGAWRQQLRQEMKYAGLPVQNR